MIKRTTTEIEWAGWIARDAEDWVGLEIGGRDDGEFGAWLGACFGLASEGDCEGLSFSGARLGPTGTGASASMSQKKSKHKFITISN